MVEINRFPLTPAVSIGATDTTLAYDLLVLPNGRTVILDLFESQVRLRLYDRLDEAPFRTKVMITEIRGHKLLPATYTEGQLRTFQLVGHPELDHFWSLGVDYQGRVIGNRWALDLSHPHSVILSSNASYFGSADLSPLGHLAYLGSESDSATPRLSYLPKDQNHPQWQLTILNGVSYPNVHHHLIRYLSDGTVFTASVLHSGGWWFSLWNLENMTQLQYPLEVTSNTLVDPSGIAIHPREGYFTLTWHEGTKDRYQAQYSNAGVLQNSYQLDDLSGLDRTYQEGAGCSLTIKGVIYDLYVGIDTEGENEDATPGVYLALTTPQVLREDDRPEEGAQFVHLGNSPSANESSRPRIARRNDTWALIMFAQDENLYLKEVRYSQRLMNRAPNWNWSWRR